MVQHHQALLHNPGLASVPYSLCKLIAYDSTPPDPVKRASGDEEMRELVIIFRHIRELSEKPNGVITLLAVTILVLAVAVLFQSFSTG